VRKAILGIAPIVVPVAWALAFGGCYKPTTPAAPRNTVPARQPVSGHVRAAPGESGTEQPGMMGQTVTQPGGPANPANLTNPANPTAPVTQPPAVPINQPPTGPINQPPAGPVNQPSGTYNPPRATGQQPGVAQPGTPNQPPSGGTLNQPSPSSQPTLNPTPGPAPLYP
jgi:hypothetical protein